jgi:hypothetical protein
MHHSPALTDFPTTITGMLAGMHVGAPHRAAAASQIDADGGGGRPLRRNDVADKPASQTEDANVKFGTKL